MRQDFGYLPWPFSRGNVIVTTISVKERTVRILRIQRHVRTVHTSGRVSFVSAANTVILQLKKGTQAVRRMTIYIIIFTPVLVLGLLLSLFRWTDIELLVKISFRCFIYTFSMLVLKARSVLLLFALSRKLSHSRRVLCRVGYYIICPSSSVRLRRGCGLSLSLCF